MTTQSERGWNPHEYLQEVGRIQGAVHEFAERMLLKLNQKYHAGYRGWDDPDMADVIRRKLEDHAKALVDGDWKQAVDVAKFAMMLHHLGYEEAIAKGAAILGKGEPNES